MDSEAEASDGERTLSPMVRLPDELLMMILSRVQDAVTLLYSVPLVCRRWRRLSEACWIDVDLRLPYFDAGPRGLRVRTEYACLLQYAPAASRLRLSLELEERKVSPSKSVRLTKVLRCCFAGISELCIEHVEPWKGKDYETACKRILRLIKSNGHHLKKFTLKVEGIIEWSESLAKRGLWPGLPGALLHCSALRSLHCPASCVSSLRAMPGLAELELYFAYEVVDMEGMPRPEEPWPAAASLPALRSLAFKHCESQHGEGLYPWAGELMVALCRAAPGLTRLSAVCDEDSDGDCVCAADELQLDEALTGLPGLRSVRLHGDLSILTPLTNQPLDALDDIELGVKCWDHKDFMLKVKVLRAARPQARVAIEVHMMEPSTMKFEWPRLHCGLECGLDCD